jgi:hypothetical protein
MAVLEEVPALEVSVHVAGELATEYADPDPAKPRYSCPTSSKYIESVSGAEFAVHFKVRNTYSWGYRNHSLALYVYIDGKFADGSVVRSSTIQGPVYSQIFRGRRSADLMGRVILNKFQFSAVTTSKLYPVLFLWAFANNTASRRCKERACGRRS